MFFVSPGSGLTAACFSFPFSVKHLAALEIIDSKNEQKHESINK